MREEIQKILELSVNAPSGSNSQPWSFVARENQIDVIAYPEKDHPILNLRNRGTWIAHGALVENILITARARGWQTQLQVFPDDGNPNLTARVSLEKGTGSGDEGLFESIAQRITNRKPFATAPLNSEQKQKLAAAAGSVGGGVNFGLIEDKNKLAVLGAAASANEVVMFENKELHRLFFEELVWSEGEEKERGGGLFLKTMELKPPQQKALKLFRRWPVMNFLNKLGLARSLARENAKGYAAVGAMGIVAVGERGEDYLNAGRLIERVWLQAIKMRFSVHLITGVFFFWQRIRAGFGGEFSPKHLTLIEKAYRSVETICPPPNEKVLVALLRIGDGGEPSARSIKKPPSIVFK